MKTRHTILILLAFLFASCNLSDNKTGVKKDFYNSIADWDIKYVPIIPPFRASSTYPGQWVINGSQEILHLGKNRGGDIPVNSFGVSKNYIYGKTENGQWFLFNINSLVYSEYSTDTELYKILNLFKLGKNQIESCDKYFQQLSDNKRCYWYPKVGEEYQKFEDKLPDKVYTVLVDGKEKATDFKVKETIQKSVSKLYYFTVRYDNERNDLFYVSFDYSPPQLIDKNKIYTAYCEDNVFLDISIYTPFPVGQSKGIDEKDRIVLSKQIELK
ncbi:hypothetical protein [Limnovirga soli]|uniref:Uncharacterized protein n=1 Tax=Limnovirga soli TaxID=2656915 RepID=A0A8J8FGT8_9BACT|nr:hypothetical protein [Limnovirga soli]NNV57400.1 hypothetical protein [Limnovirga soli]